MLVRSRLLFAIAVAALAASTAWAASTGVPSGRARTRQAAPDTDPDVTTIYRGTLGTAVVQMRIAANPDEPRRYTGDYFVFGGGPSVLLAGEIDDEHFRLEESEDGVAATGRWDGLLVVEQDRAYIVGTWHNADDTESRPFKLERVLRTRTVVKRST